MLYCKHDFFSSKKVQGICLISYDNFRKVITQKDMYFFKTLKGQLTRYLSVRRHVPLLTTLEKLFCLPAKQALPLLLNVKHWFDTKGIQVLDLQHYQEITESLYHLERKALHEFISTQLVFNFSFTTIQFYYF